MCDWLYLCTALDIPISWFCWFIFVNFSCTCIVTQCDSVRGFLVCPSASGNYTTYSTLVCDYVQVTSSIISASEWLSCKTLYVKWLVEFIWCALNFALSRTVAVFLTKIPLRCLTSYLNSIVHFHDLYVEFCLQWNFVITASSYQNVTHLWHEMKGTYKVIVLQCSLIGSHTLRTQW